ncbi:MAG TPA: hypothetical protein VLX56_07050 [Nitrososphaerales archaeon]|nr:hypothetical protein [Nitrososphaerales archaeon]
MTASTPPPRPPESVVSYFRGAQSNLTVGAESNGKGVIGFIVDLPGAYVRGRTEPEALSKVGAEANRYLAWIGMEGDGRARGFVTQRCTSTLAVEDADNLILLDADRKRMRPEEFTALSDLAAFSGLTFEALYTGAQLKQWPDPSKARACFHGPCPSSIEATKSHVSKTQVYYLSRLGLHLQEGDYMMMRRLGLSLLRREFDARPSSPPVEIDGELWTVKKVLRRLVWHDRIHAKAVVRIMRKQEQLGLIHGYADPFRFSSAL